MAAKRHVAFWSCFWQRWRACLPKGQRVSLAWAWSQPGPVLVRARGRRRGEG
jgi:hypothetical protein